MMNKANHDLNLYEDLVADLGVPFVCPNCNELFGNEEYLSQHTDICNISKSDFSSDIHPGKHSDNHNSITSHIRSFSFNHNPPSELKHQEIEQRNDIPSVLPSFVPFCLDATISSPEVFHSLTPQPLENCTHHSNDVLLSSTNHTHSQMAFPSMDEPGNKSEPVGCHDVKYRPKVVASIIGNSSDGDSADLEHKQSGPITCVHCMQLHVDQFHFDQHVGNCPGTHNQHSSLNDLSLVSTDAAVRDPPDESSSKALVQQQIVNPENVVNDTSGIQVCKECGRCFTNKTDLKTHLRIHTGEKPFVCTECGQKFAHKSNLTKHYSVHTQEKPFVCPLCTASFALKSGLKLHWRTHTGEKPYECLECGQRFSSNGNLKKHMVIHSGEKPFTCKVCGRRYSSIEALECHSSTHTGEKCFVCPMCNVGFTHKNGLQAHIRTHTGEKPFLCDHCDLSFARRGGLKLHMRIHTGEKPFTCSECGQAFSHKSNLNAHYRTHTGEKPFTCPWCNQKFGHNSNLKKHVMTHGNELLTGERKLSSSSSSTTNDSSELPSSTTTVRKMTALLGSHFAKCHDPKLFDLMDVDMLEHPSTQVLLGT